MSESLKWILSTVVVPILIGLGASQVNLARLDERIAGVREFSALGISEAKAMAQEAKDSAQDAHKRINFFHGGG